jgi:hypothetical protein
MILFHSRMDFGPKVRPFKSQRPAQDPLVAFPFAAIRLKMGPKRHLLRLGIWIVRKIQICEVKLAPKGPAGPPKTCQTDRRKSRATPGQPQVGFLKSTVGFSNETSGVRVLLFKDFSLNAAHFFDSMLDWLTPTRENKVRSCII